MGTLSENPEWVDVYQLETTDPVVGGAPNESTGDGMSNIPHLHLAKRTAFLKDLIEGAGMGAEIGPEVSNFNNVARSGLYWGSSATGAPNSDPYVLLHMQGSAEDESVQLAARIPSNRVFLRRRTGGTWHSWVEIAHGGNLNDLLGGLSDSVVTKAGEQTITGEKTFDASPLVPTPSADAHAARKAYVDGAVASAVSSLNSTISDLVSKSRTISAGTGLAGGGDLSADRTLSVLIASAAQLLSGSSANRLITPEAVREAAEFKDLADGSITPDFANGRNFRIPLTVNSTLQTPTGLQSGQSGEILVEQDATGGRDLSFAATWKFFGSNSQIDTSEEAATIISYKVVSASKIIASITWEAP